MNDIRKAKAKRHEGQWQTAADSLIPLLPTLVQSGDKVSKYLLTFVQNGKEVGVNVMRRHCNFSWKVDDGATAMSSMTVQHQSRTKTTLYFSLERIYVEKGTYDSADKEAIEKRFTEAVIARVRGYDVVKDAAMNTTMLIFAPMLKELAEDTIGTVVEFREDNGLHLVFQESDNPNLFIKVYIGAAFDTQQTPSN